MYRHDKHNRIVSKYTGVLMSVLFLCLFSFVFKGSNAYASTTIYNETYDEQILYSDPFINFYVNGCLIYDREAPSFLYLDTIAMVPAEALFSDALGYDYYYDARTGQISVSNSEVKLKLTVGKNIATLNDDSFYISCAPLVCRFNNSEKSTVYIPVRSIVNEMDFYFTWYESKFEIQLFEMTKLKIEDQSYIYCDDKFNVSVNGYDVEFESDPGLYYKGVAMVRMYHFYDLALGCTTSENGNELKISYGDINVQMTIGSKTAIVNGCSYIMQGAPVIIANRASKQEYVYVPIESVNSYLGFDSTYNKYTGRYLIHTNINTGHSEKVAAISEYRDFEELFVKKEKNIKEHYNWIPSDDLTYILEEKKNLKTSIILNKELGELKYFDLKHFSVSKDVLGIQNAFFTFDEDFYRLDVRSDTTGSFILDLSRMYTDGNLKEKKYSDLTYSSVKPSFQVSANYQGIKYSFSAPGLTSKGAYKAGLFYDTDSKTAELRLYPTYFTGISAYSVDDLDVVRISSEDFTIPEVKYSDKTLQIRLKDRYFAQDIISEELNTVKSMKIEVKSDNTEDSKGRLVQFDTLVSISSDRNYKILYTDYCCYIVYYDDPGTPIVLSDIIQNDGNDKLYYEDELIVFLDQDMTNAVAYDEDDYLNNTIRINIKGNYKDSFDKSSMIHHLGSIVSAEASYDEINDITTYTIICKKIQAYSYQFYNNMLRIRIGDPDEFYDKIVVIDAGHGGYDSGAVNGKTEEADINLMIVRDHLKPLLDESDIKVYYTRLTDKYIALLDRAHFAGQCNADMFISCHINSAASPDANGVSVYYFNGLNITNKKTGLSSKEMAYNMQNTLSAKLSLKNRGVFSDYISVITYNSIPSILIELGFISNDNDFARLTNKHFRDMAALYIYEEIENNFINHPTNRQIY